MAKKRANGEGTIRQRKDGTWEARMTVDGKVKYFYGKTQSKAIAARKAYKKMLEDGLNIEAGKMTVGQWLDIWLKYYTVGIKHSTAVKYEVDIRLHIKPYIGSIKLSALKTPAIQKLYNQKLDSELSPKSLKNVHGVLHKALDQAVKLGYMSRNVSDLCVLPKVLKDEIHPLKDDEVPRFLHMIQGNQFEMLFLVTLFTGMRQGEALGLQWDSVDFTRGTIHIHHQLQRFREKGKGSHVGFAPPKNNKERTIMPARQVMDILRKVKNQQDAWAKQYAEIWDNSMNLVFTNQQGRHLSDNTVYKCTKRFGKALGRPELRFHDLRHTYATLSLQNGDDIKMLSTNLGHATTAFTMDVYGHVSRRMLEDSAARMEKYISNL